MLPVAVIHIFNNNAHTIALERCSSSLLLCHRTFHWPTLGPVFDHLYDLKFFFSLFPHHAAPWRLPRTCVWWWHIPTQTYTCRRRVYILPKQHMRSRVTKHVKFPIIWILHRVSVKKWWSINQATFSQRSFTCINCVRHNKNYSTTYTTHSFAICICLRSPFNANNKHLCSYVEQTYVFMHSIYRECYSNSSHKRRINDLAVHEAHFFAWKTLWRY